jgi:hypothetical protein
MRYIIVLILLMTFALPALAQGELQENIPIRSGGIEIFPQPDRDSGRLFAVIGDFAPHIAGMYSDADARAWVYFYFIEAGQWMGAWALASQFHLGEDALADLPEIDPANVPEIPEMPFNALAVRPSGIGALSISDDPNSATVIYDVYDCLFVVGTEFMWNVVEVTYEDGIAVSAEVLEEGLRGEWRPGCPGLPTPQIITGDGGVVAGGGEPSTPQGTILISNGGTHVGGWIFGDITYDLP